MSLCPPEPNDGRPCLRSQEVQRENAFLRAQFAERADCAVQEQAEAERRLGAVEAETRRLTDVLRESTERHGEELRKQEERVSVTATRIYLVRASTKCYR